MSALMLFTRDLRISDNRTLLAAAQAPEIVCGIRAEDTSDWGQSKRQFYQSCIEDLAYHLAELGHKLYFIEQLDDFDHIYCSQSYNTIDNIDHPSVPITKVAQGTLFQQQELPFTIDQLPKTFTPFRHKMDKVEKPAIAPTTITALPKAATYEADHVTPKQGGGETAAGKRLAEYFTADHALSYFDTRNGLIEFNDSTKFSPYLAWGCLSPGQIYYALKQFEKNKGSNKSTYWIVFELLWRDYFKWLSVKFGAAIFAASGTAQRQLPTLTSEQESRLFEQWTNAETEEPFVNANMRELNETGWMSNRGRQNVASFLCKNMGVNWLLGAQYFAQHLIDYDVESNYGNWAYLAGVGVDPRDRQFNIGRQAHIYDPHGAYQRRWLGEHSR